MRPDDDSSPSDVRALLIDDDEAWTETVTGILKKADGEMGITAVHDERAARAELNKGSFDCVICDYGLPGASGLELLKRFRSDRPGLAYVLITSKGSEQIASEAIATGVDDYVRKQEVVEHPEVLINRVQNAVANKLTQQRLKWRNERYEMLAESVAEGVCYYRDGGIVDANEQFCDLLGCDRSRLGSMDVSTFVHEADGDTFRRATEEMPATKEEIRVVDSLDNVRYCLLTTRNVAATDAPSICVLQDITAQRQREQALRQQLDTRGAIWSVLAHETTKSELANRFCDRLARTVDDCELALVVTPGEGTTRDTARPEAAVSAAAGDAQQYRSELQDADPALRSADPAVRALDAASPVIVRSGELAADEWQPLAEEHGFSAGVAVPIAHDDIRYGAVGIYSGSRRPDIPGSEVVEGLGRTLAYAFSAVEMRNSLMNDSARYARLRVPDDRCALAALADRAPFEESPGEIATFLDGAEANQLYGRTEAAPAPVEDALGACSRVAEHETEVAPDGATRFRFQPSGRHTGEVLLDNRAAPESAVLTDGAAVVTARLTDGVGTNDLVDALEAEFDGVELLATGALDRAERSATRSELLDPLTDRQLESIRAAYRRGYFEQPKGASAEDIAEDLDITRTTFTQHLRTAQRKLLGTLFDGSEPVDP